MAFYSKRIGSKTLMISDHPENPNLCYKWTNGGGNTTARGNRKRFVCAGCRKIKDSEQVASDVKLPARIMIDGQWENEGHSYEHFCEPFQKSQILGNEVCILKYKI